MVSVNLASIPDREEQLKHTVYSLIKQVRVVNICLNNYDHNPFKGNKKVNVVFSDNSLGDAGKFMFLKDWNGYYFTVDDDLIYDPYYIEETISKMQDKKIVSYHGRSFDSFPVSSYYRSATEKYQCLGDVKEDVMVQFAGTGCMAFHTDNFKPSMDIFKRKNCADIWIGLEADRLGIPITCLNHKSDYFKYQQVPDTIWDQEHLSDEFQTKTINQHFK